MRAGDEESDWRRMKDGQWGKCRSDHKDTVAEFINKDES